MSSSDVVLVANKIDNLERKIDKFFRFSGGAADFEVKIKQIVGELFENFKKGLIDKITAEKSVIFNEMRGLNTLVNSKSTELALNLTSLLSSLTERELLSIHSSLFLETFKREADKSVAELKSDLNINFSALENLIRTKITDDSNFRQFFQESDNFKNILDKLEASFDVLIREIFDSTIDNIKTGFQAEMTNFKDSIVKSLRKEQASSNYYIDKIQTYQTKFKQFELELRTYFGVSQTDPLNIVFNNIEQALKKLISKISTDNFTTFSEQLNTALVGVNTKTQTLVDRLETKINAKIQVMEVEISDLDRLVKETKTMLERRLATLHEIANTKLR